MLPLFAQSIDPEKIAEADSTAHARITETFNELTQMPVEEALVTVTNAVVKAGLKILIAVVVFIVGRWLVNKLIKFLNRIFELRDVDVTLRTFLSSLTKTTLMVILLFVIVGVLGLNTASFIAIFASAGLALGIALSGTLQNFAGGVMMLFLKPYRIGDYITSQDQGGTVKSIGLFHTTINTPDNSTVLLPNGSLSNSIINNTSKEVTRRLEWFYDIAYGDDFDKAKRIIAEILNDTGKIMEKPEWEVEINKLTDGAVNVVVHAWVKAEDFWSVFYAVNKEVYRQLPDNGIVFPYQQIDVSLTDKTAAGIQKQHKPEEVTAKQATEKPEENVDGK